MTYEVKFDRSCFYHCNSSDSYQQIDTIAYSSLELGNITDERKGQMQVDSQQIKKLMILQ